VHFFSNAKVFKRIARYDLCFACGSVQISKAPWLVKAHNGGIVETDTGTVSRSTNFARDFTLVMHLEGRKFTSGVDFGGGSGLLTRLLRDRGFDCKSFDPYADQFLASGFVVEPLGAEKEYDFLTLVECIEHLENPFQVLERFGMNKHLLIFTTETISEPPPNPSDKNPWWYYSPESGQHISFASNRGLEALRLRLKFAHYYTISGLHIFSRDKINPMTIWLSKFPRLWLILAMYVDHKSKQKYSLSDSDSKVLKQILNQ